MNSRLCFEFCASSSVPSLSLLSRLTGLLGCTLSLSRRWVDSLSHLWIHFASESGGEVSCLCLSWSLSPDSVSFVSRVFLRVCQLSPLGFLVNPVPFLHCFCHSLLVTQTLNQGSKSRLRSGGFAHYTFSVSLSSLPVVSKASFDLFVIHCLSRRTTAAGTSLSHMNHWVLLQEKK